MRTSLATRPRLGRALPCPPPRPAGFNRHSALDDSPRSRQLAQLAVTRAKAGDEEAFRYLYSQYADNIYGYVRSIVRDDYEAEDVTQHVFAKLMTSISKYDDRGVPFFAWLLRLSRNVAIDHLRRNRAIPQEDVLSTEASFGSGVDNLMTIREALAALPADQREVVVLRHIVGLSPGEIADRMGRTEGSVHGLHHRGRRTLQRELSRLEIAPSTASSELAAA